jgi:hypothetical protein
MFQLPHHRGVGRTVVLACAIVAAAGSSGWCQTSRTYTTTADFRQGTPNHVNAVDVPDQLQLDVAGPAMPFPVINVAATGRGTLIRIDGATGTILGEYATSPDGLMRNPSRTATDAAGNVWVGNRNAEKPVDGIPKGSVVKVGLCVGGTRVDANGAPNPNGLYLAGPFTYNTCVDRNGDGLIRTSRGLADVLPWPNVTDGMGGTDGIVQDAVDEAILVYQRTSGIDTHHVSLDGNGNVWVAGFPFVPDDFDLLDGQTGAILQTFANPMCGGYGGIVDGNGVLWSTTGEGGSDLLRFVIATQTQTCIDLTQFGTNNTGENHGLGIGPDGSIWVTQFDLDQVLKFNPDGSIVPGFPKPTFGDSRDRSVAISADGHAWVDGSLGNRVSRLDANGVFLKAIDLGADGQSPRGMAVDSFGYVWTTCTLSDTAKRIDPNGGPDGLGAVDLTVYLGRSARPFNFSEMTGTNSISVPQPSGTWEVLYDSQVVNNEYGRIAWNASIPAGTGFTVQYRVSDDPGTIASLPYVAAQNGAPFSGVFGRYVNVLATFTRPPGSTVTPVLFDLTIEGLAGPGPGTDCPVGIRKPASLLVFPEFDSRDFATTLITVTNTNGDFGPVGNLYAGTVDVEYVYIGKQGANGQPLDCFETNFTRRLTPNDTLSVIASAHNPNQELGYVYVFAKDPQTGQAIVFNHLTGSAIILDGMSGADYAFEPYAYLGIGAHGTPTDDDADGVRDLNNLEYSCTPDELLFPRFFGQSEAIPGVGPVPGYTSDLVLLNLSGGKDFDTVVDILLYNDNEEVFSAQTGFVCWVKRPLLDINSAFSQQFLASTNDNPNEVLGAPGIETGWFRLDGRIASSSAAVVQDPSILALLVERLPLGRAACDLPFESGAQTNGDLLLVGLLGDPTP